MLIRTGFKFQCSTFLLRKRKHIQSTKRTSFLRTDKIKFWFEFVDASEAIIFLQKNNFNYFAIFSLKRSTSKIKLKLWNFLRKQGWNVISEFYQNLVSICFFINHQGSRKQGRGALAPPRFCRYRKENRSKNRQRISSRPYRFFCLPPPL